MEIYLNILIEAIICLILAIILLFFYVRKGTNPIVIIISIFTWFLNFFMIILLPYDICLTNKIKADPNLSDTEEKTSQIIKICYRSIYWSIFFSTWIFMPLLNKYESSGEFTKWDKIKYSIRSNLIYYGVLYSLLLNYI